MRIARKVALLAAVLAACTAWPSAQAPRVSVRPVSPNGEAPASIAGRVVDGVTGRPVANASVTVYGVPVFSVNPNYGDSGVIPMWAAAECSTRSDSHGQFACDGLDPFAYELFVRKDWASGAFGQRTSDGVGRVLTLTPGQRLRDVRVPLWRDPIVSGRVLGARGEPLIGMTVTAMPIATLTRRSIDAERRQFRSTTTDDRGAYVLAVDPGEVVLMASSGRSNPPRSEIGGRPAIYPVTFSGDVRDAAAAQRLVLSAGTDRDGVDITVQPLAAFRVTGRVSAQVPVNGTDVVLVRAAGNDAEELAVSRTTVVGASGQFTLPDVPSGEYRLRVLRAQWMPTGSHGYIALDSLPTQPTLWADVPVVVNEKDAEVDVTLNRGVRVSGRVVFEGGEAPAVSQTTFVLRPMNALQADVRGLLLPSLTFSTIEIAQGTYLMTPPFIQGFHIQALTQGGRSILNEPIHIGSRDITDVVMTFGREATQLAGRVTRPSSLADRRGSISIVPADSSAWRNLPRETLIQTLLIGMPATYETELVPGDYLVMATDVPVPTTRAGLAEMDARATRVTVLPGRTTRLNLQLRELSR